MAQESNPGAVLTLVRHGETSANIDGVWHGSTDTALTDRGHAQAKRVAERIATRFAAATALYCSDLQRAHDTARAIGSALGHEPRLEPDLREFDLGRWEGESYANLFRVHKLWENLRDDPDFAPHGGESPRQVAERFSTALRRIARRHEGERVVVVTHGGALSIGLGALIDDDYRTWKRVMDNCAISELVVDPVPELRSFNEVDHLEGL